MGLFLVASSLKTYFSGKSPGPYWVVQVKNPLNCFISKFWLILSLPSLDGRPPNQFGDTYPRAFDQVSIAIPYSTCLVSRMGRGPFPNNLNSDLCNGEMHRRLDYHKSCTKRREKSIILSFYFLACNVSPGKTTQTRSFGRQEAIPKYRYWQCYALY